MENATVAGMNDLTLGCKWLYHWFRTSDILNFNAASMGSEQPGKLQICKSIRIYRSEVRGYSAS